MTSATSPTRIDRELLTTQQVSSPKTTPSGLGDIPTTLSKAPEFGKMGILPSSSPTHLVKSLESIGVGDATIPLIDLEAIESASVEERALLIKKFGDSLKTVGFIAVKAEALTAMIDKVDNEMIRYFSQPLEEKMKDWRNNNGQTGFSQQGRETAAGAKVADLKETYFVSPNYNDWPTNPSFRETMEPYHKALTRYAALIMGYLAEYLGEPTEDVSKSVSDAGNLLRLAYYPAPKQEDNPEAVWAKAHKDLNGITLLPPSKVPGLHMYIKDPTDNKCKPVPVICPKGYIIVNTGEQLWCKSAGMFNPTEHEVVNMGGEYARKARYASIFFASWSSSFSLKPLETCVKAMTIGMTEIEKQKYLKQFPDVTVEENLLSRLIELNTFKNPPEQLVSNLRSKGLLQAPPEALISKYPKIFASE